MAPEQPVSAWAVRGWAALAWRRQLSEQQLSEQQLSAAWGWALPAWALPAWALPAWALPAWALPAWALQAWALPAWALPAWRRRLSEQQLSAARQPPLPWKTAPGQAPPERTRPGLARCPSTIEQRGSPPVQPQPPAAVYDSRHPARRSPLCRATFRPQINPKAPPRVIPLDHRPAWRRV